VALFDDVVELLLVVAVDVVPDVLVEETVVIRVRTAAVAAG
jgi:hypothetical protein